MQKNYVSKTYRRMAIIISTVLSVFAFVIMYFGWKFYSEAQALEKNGIITTGEVVDIRKNGIYRSPYIKFTTREGEEITFLSELEVAKDFYKYPVGVKVEILYDKENPYNAVINKELEKNFLHYFLFGFGILLLLVAFGTNRYYSAKARKNNNS